MKRSLSYSLASLLGLGLAAAVAQSQFDELPQDSSRTPIDDFISLRDEAAVSNPPILDSGLTHVGVPISTRFTVIGASQKPELGAIIEGFDGRSIRAISNGLEVISVDRFMPANVNPSAFSNRELHQMSDQVGEFSPPSSMMVILGESGYQLTTLDAIQKHPRHAVELKPWIEHHGTVNICGKPLTNARVYATWESFPHSPAMTSLSHEMSLLGPVMLTYKTSAELSEDGTFRFKDLPEGRIRFRIGGPLNSSQRPTWLSNLAWWETVTEKPKNDLLPEISQVQNFEAFWLTGSLKMTDHLLAARTNVRSEAGRAVISYRQARIGFHPPTLPSAEPWNIEDDSGFRSQRLTNVMKQAVVWARPGGERESEAIPPLAQVSKDGKFTCLLQKADYQLSLQFKIETPPGVLEQWAEIAANFSQVSDPNEDDNVELENIEVGQMQPMGAATDEFDGGGDFDARPLEASFSSNPAVNRGFDAEFAVADDFSPDEFGAQPGLGPMVNVPMDPFADRPGFGHGEVEQFSPGSIGALQSSGLQPVAGGGMPFIQNARANNSPLESSIASLVTDLLAAGDRRTRQQLKQPLKDLLSKKFDAEQQAREALVAELNKRLAAATKQVRERASNRDRIVNEQLQRILSLPEDEFQLLSEPASEPDRSAVDSRPIRQSPFRDADFGDSVPDRSNPLMPEPDRRNSDPLPSLEPAALDDPIDTPPESVDSPGSSRRNQRSLNRSSNEDFRPQNDRTPKPQPRRNGLSRDEAEDLSPPPAVSDSEALSAD